MDKSITYIVRVIVTSWKSEVGFFIYPYREGVPVSDKYPLSNIKFSILYDETIFYVLLCNELRLFLLAKVEYFYKLLVKYDPSTSTTASWLNNPYIFLSI